jgi:hypothetical protein
MLVNGKARNEAPIFMIFENVGYDEMAIDILNLH